MNEVVLTPTFFSQNKTWFDIFENNNPLKVDIGSGKGKFLIEMAEAEPSVNFIGVDIFKGGDSKNDKAGMKVSFAPALRY